MRAARILLVEDFEPFRRVVRDSLRSRPEFQIVGEASDGLDAIRLAQQLQPDLVLLDIGLPALNGIQVARRIRERMPSVSLLYLSQQLSADVVEEALRVGGQGYVHKLHTHRDLLIAIDVVLGGRRFVSCGLNIRVAAAERHNHEVQLYADDSALLKRTTDFLANALSAGNPAIVLATAAHRQRLSEGLQSHGIDIERAIQQGIYIDRDAAEVLSRIMMNGQPDVVRFREAFGHLLTSLRRAANVDRYRVAIVGECVGLLAAAGDVQAAIKLEQAGNDLLKTHDVEILCAYPLSSLGNGNRQTVLRDICAEHTTTYVT